VDAETDGAACLLSRADALGDVAGDDVVAGSEACGRDSGGDISSGDLAATGRPYVGGLFLQVEVAGRGGDGDGIAGEDVCRLDGAAKL